MGPMTIITQIEDTSDVVPTHVTLMTFDSIISLNNDAIVDTIGVIIRIEDIVDIVKPTKTLKLRDVIIADNTGIEITITLWNEEASVFSGKIEDVLSVEKGKSVVYKKGKKLSVTQSTVIQINPNWLEKEVLKEWYKKEGQYQVNRMDLTQSSSIDNTTLNQSVDDKIFSHIVKDEKSTKRRLDEIYVLQEQLQSEITELTFKKIRLNLERQAVENRIINRRQKDIDY
ncbi:uncharacterized protein LOC132944749 [Metopolophium dirhodum]|uniref:uncharacterized protein LOC132944749 n=1 Tax=Metopolophium dirhodum TaxID=44670 RepID=UPI0029903FE8|nr:uncharacterized protein LOC132944749 [Metopolophium dirhodum]